MFYWKPYQEWIDVDHNQKAVLNLSGGWYIVGECWQIWWIVSVFLLCNYFFFQFRNKLFVIVNYRGSLQMDSFSYTFRSFFPIVTAKIDVLSSLDYSNIFKYKAKNSPDVSMLRDKFEYRRDFVCVCVSPSSICPNSSNRLNADINLLLSPHFPLILLLCLLEFSVKIMHYLVKMRFPCFLLKILIRHL